MTKYRDLPWLDVKVLIVDGNSKDNTCEEAEKRGARFTMSLEKVMEEHTKLDFSLIDTDYVATIDGDTTYPADKIPYVLAFLINNNLDFVTCNRLDKNGSRCNVNYSSNRYWGLTFGTIYSTE